VHKQTENFFVIAGATAAFFSLSLPLSASAAEPATVLEDMETLGSQLFFDKNLSQPKGRQSCASCHDAGVGFTSPNRAVNLLGSVMPGAIPFRFGPRKPPTATYATMSADFDINGPSGGTFWDGRATGNVVTPRIFPDAWGDPAEDGTIANALAAKDTPAVDQAMGPFLNDVEMNLPSAVELCKRVQTSSYAALWERAWGEPVNCSTARAPVAAADGLADLTYADLTHQRVAFAIGVFEDTLNTFSSKRDVALATDADGQFPLDGFTPEENTGHDLFYDRINGCAAFCHSSSFRADGTLPDELYTPANGSGYFNLGVPRNPFNPFYLMRLVRNDNGNPINPDGFQFVDLGIGGVDFDGDGTPDFPDRKGEFKIPTMRNLVSGNFLRAYFHNGYFKSLKEVIHFYNTRDVKPVCTDRRGNPQQFVTAAQAIKRDCWPVAEVEENIFGCGDGANTNTEHCKVALAEGETIEDFCANPVVDNPSRPGRTIDRRDIGNLCMTEEQENAIVSYLETLTDTVVIQPPKPEKPAPRGRGRR
jgi:cytochrome c peroxidase